MSNIFISYRRSDSSGYVIAIYERLIQKFDRDQIFRDLDAIDIGVDFVETIENAVQKCDILLAIIGPQWLNTLDENGRRRLDNVNDFVRLEVGTALRRNIRVIPILVSGATMPHAVDLPEDLQALVRRNALEVSDRDFGVHMGRLIEAIEQVVARKDQVDDWTIDIPEMLPEPFAWCEVPIGDVTVVYPGERGKQSFKVPRFFMAKYPITNAQWDVFAQVDDGYANLRWWNFSDHAQKWRSQHSKPQSHDMAWGNHPKIMVTWFEALAFCNWLSDRTGLHITLPSEPQWQRAAQGDNGLLYPWGNDFDSAMSNTEDSNIGKTTPVDNYQQSASPFGVMDMAGNVFEWCSSEVNEIQTKLNRVPVRGASYQGLSFFAQSTSRQTFRAGQTYTDLGFRVACVRED